MSAPAPKENIVPARCLIVDDESPARDEMRYLLKDMHDVVVVGEATTAEEALVLIESVAYDIVFLDVRMPGMGGLELARTLDQRRDKPAIIFITAFADHAVEAFDLEATDYLIKPFDPTRLRRALDRALEQRASARPETSDEPPDQPAPDPAPTPAIGRIPVHRGGRVILVEEGRIAYAEAARGYAHLKLADERVLVSFTLNDLEDRLSQEFVRTHRSFLVNLRHVREVIPEVGGMLTLVMADRDRSRVPVSRRHASGVRRRLGM